VFILAALDRSVLPTLGAVDALTILLAARHPELWPYYAVCSTAGSVWGASVAYRLSGLGVLHRRIKGALFDKALTNETDSKLIRRALHE
jgi:membrane protein YqaA with SNARE-associated domain